MAIVVLGVPTDAEQREFNSLQYGPQTRLSFRVVHPGDPEDKFDLFEASNEAISQVQEAVKEGKPRKMLVRSTAQLSKKGVPWTKYLFVRFVE